MRSGLICRSGAIAGRMACILAAALLACASSAHSQVIGEGGFPVKGDGVSGESFSLSCPPRLDARAGESVLLSCSATAVLEEGIRYEWESLSGDGLHLLSNANERSPLFTAPLSGESAEYVYRLTATAPGVYETATVTVVVGGVSGGSVQDRSKSPVAQEECDPFMVPEGLGEGCAEDKGPAPFGFDPESEGEFLFPEAPSLPDQPSGPVRSGGFDRQTPPRLKCPVAAFLEELETGVIECQVSDAAGEEFLEYSWEPVGSTTRDYLDNPRLIPEDAPNPSVVASEAPVYETLESFHSGETTFRYRYRLTATSRATGLSSSSEVEVYVSSSRPSVYCPKEVVVAEGETVSLDCEGVDPLSGRIDYDEDGASILWEWEGLWGTSMAPLAATDLSSPLFTAPLGSAGEEYHYIASMTSSASGAPRTARRRVTVRVVGGEEGGQTAVKVTAQNVTEGASGMPGQVECFVLPNVYEGDPDKRFRCKIVVTGDDQLLSVTWTWEDPYDPGMLSATNIRNPVFYVPESVSATTRFDFQVTAKYQLVSGYKIETLNIYAIVNNLEVVVACDDPGNVEEGDADITFSCSATYPLSGTLRWSWSPTTRLTGHTTGTPRFDVPDDVDGDKTYTYAVRVTADRADPGGETVKVKVRDADTTAPAVRCTNASIYEGSRDITLSCSVANEPAGATYGWAGTDIANRLTGTDGLAPTFAAPDDINKPGGANKDYEYTVTLTAGGVDVATEDVTVTVLEKPDITWCGVKRYTSSYTIVWEGSSVETKAWYCAESPQGAPGHNPAYMFWWSTLGDTPATAINLLQPRDVRDPIFSIPPHGTVDEDQTYEFRATISAANADDATWDWRVIVKNSKVTVTCDDPAPVDEGDMDFDFACFAIGPPGVTYTWSWSPTTRLTDRNTGTPRFNVPGDVDGDKTYTYAVRVTADNADPGEETVTVTVTVTVRDTNPLVPVVSCNDSEVYEGSSDFDLRCTVNNKPSNASYRWSGTDIANRLRDTDSLTPTFAVPVTVNADTDYDYTVTLSAAGIDDVAEDVTVTVLNKELLTLVCAPVAPVYEDTADFDLDCSASGAPVGSDYEYVWTARGSTPNTDKLSSTTIANPTFYVPDQLEATTTYEYLLTASAENAESSSARVTVTVLNHGALSVVCADPPSAYEGSENFDLDCSASGAPVGSDYEYVWTARGATANTALLIAGTDGPTPTFAVPDALDETTTYEYLLTASAENAESSSARVTVTVLNRGALAVTCAPPPLVYEGSENFDLDCSASGAPAGSDYDYYWTPRGSTPNTDLLSDTTVLTPTFYVPDALDETTTYEYLLTVSADNAEDATAEVTVTVLNRAPLSVVCTYPGSIYEGSADFELDCSASGAPSGSDYTYVWTARENTQDTALLSAADIASPMFLVPEAVDEDETYEYLLTVSAANAEDASAEVTVTVLNKGALALVCTDAYEVYEGSEDVTLDCSASGAPSGSDYAYAWTARGNTSDTSLLSTADIASPVFYVPDQLEATTTYEYLLTASAENAESSSARVTVTVLNHGALSVVCADPPSAYEGSENFDLDCSASGAPVGSDYEYVWTARGATANTALLIAGTDGPTPTFAVPDALDETTTYEYLLTARAENAESSSARVTVTVLNRGALAVTCAPPPLVYEGSENFDLDCSASGAPVGSDYKYVWTARGATANTALLIAGTDGPTPTFAVPDALDETTTYEYLLTASAENAESSSARVTVTVLNHGALSVVCADPPSAYEGSENFDLDCSASGAPAGSDYDYYWTPRGSTPNTDLLSDTTVLTPTFYVPDALDETTTYEYLLTVSADNAEDATAEVTVTVLNRAPLSVVCTYPGSIYEGSADFELDCSASGAPSGSDYTYVWTARGSTQDTALLSAADIASPMFLVPEAVDEDETYEYLLTVSAANAEDASAEVTVTVLNKGALALVCTDAYEVYEGSEDVTLDCSASGAPSGSDYAYAWTARGNTSDTSLLSTADIASPVFYVPDQLEATTTHEYTLTVNAANAESASAEVTVTVLNRAPLAFVDDSISGRVYVFTVGESIADILLPQATGGLSPYTYTLAPALPEGLELDDPTRTISGTPLQVSPRSEYTWQVVDANAETVQIAFFIEVVPAADTTSPPVAESSPEAAEPPSLESLSLGVTVSASSLDFGVQSAETQVSLDPMTDQISTYVSGPYHGGRMMLALDGSAEVDESGNMALSIELASPVVLRREGGIEASSIVLSPNWSLGESCEQLSSQTIGGLYTEVTLSEDACRLLRFGGELDLTDVPSGRYAGSMDVILRSGESEETHSVEVDVTVIPAQQVITIGPGGVRFSTSRELPVSLSEEQNLSIYPDVAFLTEEKPNGVFELSNPSLIPLEISVSARFGYTEATENGREVVVEDISESHLGDLSQVVDIHPGVLVLMPGEKGLVRYGMQEGALTAMAEKGYTAFFDVVSEPRQYVRSDQMPEEVTGEKTARVTMRVPGVYVPGEGASQLRATLLSISFVDPMSATFLLETLDHPFVGEVVAYDGDGRELGRRETLVYTRSRVRVPLDRMPEEETVFLRFAPRGSGRVPEPASVEWDAPRRDIGAAEDKDRATTTKTLARKP